MAGRGGREPGSGTTTRSSWRGTTTRIAYAERARRAAPEAVATRDAGTRGRGGVRRPHSRWAWAVAMPRRGADPLGRRWTTAVELAADCRARIAARGGSPAALFFLDLARRRGRPVRTATWHVAAAGRCAEYADDVAGAGRRGRRGLVPGAARARRGAERRRSDGDDHAARRDRPRAREPAARRARVAARRRGRAAGRRSGAGRRRARAGARAVARCSRSTCTCSHALDVRRVGLGRSAATPRPRAACTRSTERERDARGWAWAAYETDVARRGARRRRPTPRRSRPARRRRPS